MKSALACSLLRSLLLVAVAIWPGLSSAQNSPAEQRPHIILILTDDMGYGDVGCYGGRFVPTSHIDQLAKEGTRFTQFYSASPICSPSRTGLLTGMYPARWSIHSYLQTRAGNKAVGQADFLESKAPSLARTLKEAGYATAHIGKWHMGGGRDVTNAPPFSAYGFDEHVSTYESPQPHPELTATNWIWSARDQVKRWDRSAYFVDKTLDFLKRHTNQPCYVHLWPDDVHTPWVPEGAPLRRPAQNAETEPKFQRVLQEYDKQIGRLMEGLKAAGLDQNTIIIFTSDNGPAPAFGQRRTAGLRGRKGSVYEGGIRMPFIVRWPAKTPAGRVDEQSVLNAVDLFPTLCKLVNVPLPKDVPFDGTDVSSAFHGKNFTRTTPMFWEYGRNQTAYNYPNDRNRSPSLAVRQGNWKLLLNADGSRKELYDLENDRNESQNVAEKQPDRVERMSQAALTWKKSLP